MLKIISEMYTDSYHWFEFLCLNRPGNSYLDSIFLGVFHTAIFTRLGSI